MESFSNVSTPEIRYTTERKRILFATVPADGHFNPLTALAKHLVNEGYEVAWYAHDMYRKNITALGVKHFPFIRPPKFNQENFEFYYPERKKIKGAISKLRFDFQHAYLDTARNYFDDIREIFTAFPFDLVIADIMFSGIPYVKDKMQIPVIAVGIMPIMESSPELAPPGIGLTPAKNIFEKLRNRVLQFFAKKIIYSKLDKICTAQFQEDGIEIPKTSVIDMLYSKPDLVLQSGSLAFEYHRKKFRPTLHFAGQLHPISKKAPTIDVLKKLKSSYDKLILVTQGTIEKDPEKILVPVLKAFATSRILVVATTGCSKTAGLKARFPQTNFYITDFIPFAQVMPLADLYISNGGFGGVMMSIKYRVPMIVAGIYEGKNEICSRVGYFGAGINLRTERPSAHDILRAANQIFANNSFAENLEKIARDFESFDALQICSSQVSKLIGAPSIIASIVSIKGKEDYHIKTA
ncbi:glycosyltransferase [Pollutibacter soli]|uniref:glycosyltransferase n=1 Tax=Pollutibacter soli TaxID=3034157 RepID=UPI003013C4FE